MNSVVGWKEKPMFKILVDACVWLDLAKDYQRQAVLEVLERKIGVKERR